MSTEKVFSFVPVIGQKTSPLFSTGKQIKYKTDDDYFFFTIFQKSGGYSVCESFVAVFCLLFVCLFADPVGRRGSIDED
jgi:hypothetical protein